MTKTSNLKPFKPGQSGNPKGRPKGSRNKLSEYFLRALSDDFAAHGVEAIEKCRKASPVAYCRMIAMLLPKEFDLKMENPLAGFTDDEIRAVLAIARSGKGTDRILN